MVNPRDPSSSSSQCPGCLRPSLLPSFPLPAGPPQPTPLWTIMTRKHSFIHSGYFYSTSSSPLLLRGAPDTARILCQSFTLKRHRKLRVKDLPKVPTWQLEWDLNP